MANALFGHGRERFLGGDIDWDANDIKLVLYDPTYSGAISIDVDEYVNTDTIAAADRPTNGLSGNFASKTKTLGVADADDIVLTAVTHGTDCDGFVIGVDGGDGFVTASGTNDLLIADIDTATGLPLTPNGGNITIAWDAGASKIFKL